MRKRIGRCPRFSSEQEIELAIKMQQGDDIARSELLQSQILLILNLTFRMSNRYFKGKYLHDLFVEAVMHVNNNIHKYTPFHQKTSRHCRLSTFVGTVVKNKIISILRKRKHNSYPLNEESLTDHAKNLGITEDDLVKHIDEEPEFLIAVQEIAAHHFDGDEMIAFQSMLKDEPLKIVYENHGRSVSYWQRKQTHVKKCLWKLLLEYGLLNSDI